MTGSIVPLMTACFDSLLPTSRPVMRRDCCCAYGAAAADAPGFPLREGKERTPAMHSPAQKHQGFKKCVGVALQAMV